VKLDFKLEFQVGTSAKAHKILGKLAGRGDDEGDKSKGNENAPFEKMGDAYLFALMLGIARGEKEKVTNRKNYANFQQTIAGDIDIATILRLLGEDSDVKSKEDARTAIEEYATWGILHIQEQYFHGEEYHLGELFS
tara:strand:- start:175 stop:585 length:411 start_codon:yes stop_codon:yes gene_type:complete